MTGEDLATQTRVMLVDDHADFRDLMVALLEGQPDLKVVAQAGSMAEARAEAPAAAGFDVVVLDLGLPDGNGANLIGELREASPGGGHPDHEREPPPHQHREGHARGRRRGYGQACLPPGGYRHRQATRGRGAPSGWRRVRRNDHRR